ncbi:hypothetical protein EJP77_14930 [Paenibacillus zeisoli]|uniref:DUF2642 domain-containing protein n=1 Tax=Paenibacillus zeisoli TaxID=2496267 RepID=A0A3S1D7S9_9BACL|nr:hypothetical protein [Paenibacillus zeisoli]RUT29657.1 hypothetical protein EJP77_14930 [Paenibacillus zeisoli]
MNFRKLAQGFVGKEVEVLTPNDLISGTLISVGDTTVLLKVPPVIYGPPTDLAIIPLQAVEFIRVVAS